MRKVNSKIEDIIDQIKGLKGQNINLEVTRGRKKTLKYSGTIENIYPSIFTVRCPEEKNSLSYSYADVLCGTVNLISDKSQEDKVQEIS